MKFFPPNMISPLLTMALKAISGELSLFSIMLNPFIE